MRRSLVGHGLVRVRWRGLLNDAGRRSVQDRAVGKALRDGGRGALEFPVYRGRGGGGRGEGGLLSKGAYRALCENSGPELCTPDAVLNGSRTLW